jgi:hypothetical protein
MYIVIDIEASGLHSTSFPVEIGWCADNGVPASILIRPQRSWNLEAWDSEAEALHGHSLAKLNLHGMDVVEAASLLNAKLKGSVVLSDGIAFDRHWLAMLFDAAEIEVEFHISDVYEWIGAETRRRKLDPQRVHSTLRDFTEASSKPHRAAEDASLVRSMIKACLSER